MFHTKHLTSYADTINQAVDDLMVHLDRFAESAEEVDMLRQLGRMTMQVIGNAAFGCARLSACTVNTVLLEILHHAVFVATAWSPLYS